MLTSARRVYTRLMSAPTQKDQNSKHPIHPLKYTSGHSHQHALRQYCNVLPKKPAYQRFIAR
jgi:hypothetical protein